MGGKVSDFSGVPGLVVEIAAPCSVPWDSMAGDDRSRHCGVCQKNVFNLSGLTRAEIDDLLQDRNGTMCVRVFQREDGTVLTADCATGLAVKGALRERLKERARKAALTAGGVIATGLGLSALYDSSLGDQVRRLFGASVECHLPPENPRKVRESHERIGMINDFSKPYDERSRQAQPRPLDGNVPNYERGSMPDSK